MSVDEALSAIVSEAPLKYDQTVVNAWLGLLRSAEKETGGPPSLYAPEVKNRREFPRFSKHFTDLPDEDGIVLNQ